MGLVTKKASNSEISEKEKKAWEELSKIRCVEVVDFLSRYNCSNCNMFTGNKDYVGGYTFSVMCGSVIPTIDPENTICKHYR